MTVLLRLALVGLAIVACAGAAVGQPPQDYRWEDEAKKHQLGETELQLLRQNKFVIAGTPFKQVFTPYLRGDAPVFVTTDSLLNGFHVLLEESVYRLELAHARKLPGLLDAISKNLNVAPKQWQGNPQLIAAAHLRARLFLETARGLLDVKALPVDPELLSTVQKEIERITAAKEITKPAWLGPPDAGFRALDYSRCLPRGFYTKSPVLQRYFRAVSWLQAIPFRLDNDEEVAAFFLLHRAYRDPKSQGEPVGRELFGSFRAFLGSNDDWELPSAYHLPKEITKDGLNDIRNSYRMMRESVAEINDQLRLAPKDSERKLEPAFRFLSAYRVPDSVLFQRTSSVSKPLLPSGLEICATLGSPFARAKLSKELPKVLKEIDECRPLFKATNLYADYLACLGVVLERTEPDAPALFHTDAWRIKTCQTALGGWAQMRHTFALHAKQGIVCIGRSQPESGFVEPVPEFYGRLAKVVDSIREVLDKAGALAVSDGKELVDQLKVALALVTKAQNEKKDLGTFTADQRSLLEQFDPRLSDWWDLPEKERQSAEKLGDAAKYLELLAAFGADPKNLPSVMGISLDIAWRWKNLAAICGQLEIIAHKQLRQVDISNDEHRFLFDYGRQLGSILFYDNDASAHPRDDAPRIVDVFSNPAAAKHLLVGIGKPRHLWVLYPFKGVEILCRGAVLPYHEFAHANRLTDADWRAMLNSPQRPEVPAWILPVAAPLPSEKKK